MFICQIQHLIHSSILFSGIRYALDHLASTNPGWSYQMSKVASGGQTAHLTIVETTESTTLEALSAMMPEVKQTRLLVLVSSRQKALITALVNDSRYAILCTDEPHFNMYDVVEKVMKKQRYLSPLVGRYSQPAVSAEDVLFTPAELSVVNWLRQGYSGVEIARQMFRSQKTISSHKRSIMKKLKVTGDLELCRCLNGMAA